MEEKSWSKRCAYIERQAKSPQHPWTESWIGRARRKTGSAKTMRSWGRRGGSALGEGKFRYCAFVRSIRSLSPKDYSYNSLMNGLIRLKETKQSCVENWTWGIDSTEKSFKRLPRNWRIEKNLLRRNRSSKTSKNWWIVHASREESFDCESIIDSNSGFSEQSKFLVRCKRILRSWIREQLWSDPRSSRPSTVPSHRTKPCRDSGLPHDTRNIVGTSGNVVDRLPAREGWTYYLQRFKEFGIFFSKTGTWCWRKYKETRDRNETRTAKFVDTSTTLPKRGCSVRSYWWNLFSQLCDRFSEISYFGIASGETPWPCGISKLESQLQNWSMFKDGTSSSHNALDQRSWDSKVNWRTYDIAIDCGAKRLLRLRYAWCDRKICLLPQKSKFWRAARSKYHRFLRGRQIACMIYEHFRATWAFEAVYKDPHSDFYRMTMSKISTFDGMKLFFFSASDLPFRCDPGRIAQVKITRLCSASDCVGFVRPRNCSKQWTNK